MLQSLCLCPGTGHELPGLGAVAGLLSGTDAGSFPDVSELAGAAPAACLWTSVMAWPSATSFWTSLLASHFISGWQTLLGSRRPASSHTESIGSATRHKANTAYSRESAQYQHCFEFVQIYINTYLSLGQKEEESHHLAVPLVILLWKWNCSSSLGFSCGI